MKFAHMILCGLAAVAFPVAAAAKDSVTSPVASTSTASSATTLFAGSIDMPVAPGSTVPANCNFPAGLSSAQGYELACVAAAPDDGADVEYIAWLGEHGWRHAADIEGGMLAVRETANGCEQQLNIYLHGQDTTDSGIWFALRREPQCTEAR